MFLLYIISLSQRRVTLETEFILLTVNHRDFESHSALKENYFDAISFNSLCSFVQLVAFSLTLYR